MEKSNKSWIVIVVVIVLGILYFVFMKPAQPEVNPSTNVGLNGSPS